MSPIYFLSPLYTLVNFNKWLVFDGQNVIYSTFEIIPNSKSDLVVAASGATGFPGTNPCCRFRAS